MDDFIEQFLEDEQAIEKTGQEFVEGLMRVIVEVLGDAYIERPLHHFARMLIDTGISNNREMTRIQRDPLLWKEFLVKYSQSL